MSTTMLQIETNEDKESATIETEENLEIGEEEEIFFQDIYLLTKHGISVEDIEQMRKIGLNTIKGIQMTIRPKLLAIKDFDERKVDQIQEACCKISLNNGFMTALEVSEERKQVFKLSTGSSNLDKLLGGGIESMAVTEVFGESRTGKTQIAHTLCVTAQIPSTGYSGGKVMFIDTEHTFRPERIRHIAHRFELDEKSVLENILYARAYNSEHQYELLKNVGTKFHEEAGVFKLLIVDSIMALFRVDFLGRGELVTRQQKLGQMMSRLQKISEEYNVAVFITNQITSDFKFTLLDMEVPKPIGGNILAHASTTRVALKKVPGNVRIAMMYDSPELEEKEEAFIITNGGIRDPNLQA
ncbi:meiotic recombination protein DMC1/LIM15 -like [Asbolus verrucosus]|uniref:Meiotic recombination protein DMC1/LIM15-like n=1 Tax=Asbolus verrucosus TaxID=1661398 RepID=A0A482VXF1_ASBVE|nr:meiotic recombination protein DMC1/LIM15 -like [Asbolus verrucosus]